MMRLVITSLLFAHCNTLPHFFIRFQGFMWIGGYTKDGRWMWVDGSEITEKGLDKLVDANYSMCLAINPATFWLVQQDCGTKLPRYICKVPSSNTLLDSSAVVSNSTFLGATTLESNTISLMTNTTATLEMEITNSSYELLNNISSSANGSRQRSNGKCICRCDEFQSYNAQLERNKMIPAEIRKKIINEQIEQITKQMTQDQNTLASAVRKKICAPDKRMSSKVFGFIFGIMVLFLVFGTIVLSDVRILFLELMKLQREIRDYICRYAAQYEQ